MIFPQESRRFPTTMAVGLIVLIGGLVYFNTLGNEFLNYDDSDSRILQNPFIGTPWQWNFLPTAFSQATAGYYDPVYVLSYAVDYHLWGMNPAGFHMGNLILHLANSVFIFLILRRLTGKQSLALVSALLFVVHPIHVESVSWATSRKDTLSHFFALASFLVYLKGVNLNASRFVGMATLSGFFLMLGMMVKPTVVVLPVIFLLSDLIFGARPIPWKRIFIFQSACLSLLLIFVVWTLPLTLGGVVKPEINFSATTHLSLFFDLYAFLIKLIVFPFNLSAFYLIEASDSFSISGLLLIFPCFMAWVIWIIRQIVRAVDAPSNCPVLWGSAVYLVSLLPCTNILPRSIYLADRYEYMASLGFCLILAYFLTRLPTLST
ncbi:MAG: glycosyltransferase family 39 protein, partial [Nitrospinae bacterium]|nr:glycosyltransferase family 39 protein [Nitrospinota bacterium]